METFEQWQQSQEAVYGKFRQKAKLVETQGVVPWTDQFTAGHLIAFRFPENISRLLGDISRQVANTVPALVYSPDLVHTTVSDFGIIPRRNFSYDEHAIETLEQLSKGVESVFKDLRKPEVDLIGLLYNQNTVIAEGHPNQDFFNAAQLIIEGCKKQGIELRMPWGAHSTVSRTYEKRNPEQLADFLKLLKGTKLRERAVLGTLDVMNLYGTL